MMNPTENDTMDKKNENIARMESWRACYASTLPQSFSEKRLSEVEGGDEIAVLNAYDCDNDEFGFILMGEVGVGKTFVLMALMVKVLEACFRNDVYTSEYVAYYPVGYLLYKLRNDRNSSDFEKCLKVRFLFLDDLGSENTTDFAREHLFTALDLRCQKNKPTFITTNLSFNELNEKYGERIVSRLKEMCIPITIKGKDRRGDILKDRVQILKERIKINQKEETK